MSETTWLTVARGDAPLIVSVPHTGTNFAGLEPRLVSPWLARKDTDWHIERLYDFAAELGATVVRTAVSRTVIDVNRDPSGRSLYPGRATTELCPTTTFDGEPLYRPGEEPGDAEIEERRSRWFDPYHATLRDETERLLRRHSRIVLYECHSIRSVIPRLFDDELPVFNLGAADGRAASPELIGLVETELAGSGEPFVVDGRFKGGHVTRAHGRPEAGVHAIQMELACRAYMAEPAAPTPETWPTPFDPDRAAPTRAVLRRILEAALDWAAQGGARNREETAR